MRYLLAITTLLCGCGQIVETSDAELAPDARILPMKPDRYCGDYNCDEDLGEDFWNCMDCVDPLTGGPKHGYCGDGVCFNESMLSCWTDCRPTQYNPDSEFGPDPDPIPEPIPLPPDPFPL